MSGDSKVPFLKIHNAIVRRDGRAILNIEDFELAEGENIALIGPNGAGKSTFVKLITREVLPLWREEPPVLYRGNARATLAETKKDLGVVSSSMQSQITVHLPVIEIVVGGLFGALGIPNHCTASPESFELAEQALAQVGMLEYKDRDVMTLSTGQSRRVLIARALIHKPKVLVFDEPTSGLDPEGMYYVRRTMRDLVAKGTSIILVTHYPEDIIPEIDRVMAIKNAHVFADGKKSEVLTTERMTELFEVPLKILSQGDYFSLVSQY
ncbi:MAG: ATP-binding cassette domain-containing protein [Coriobacteriia bacterium]|nr:ATP-binding cassette domain-containing protein [Coriobacteriia bacterium]